MSKFFKGLYTALITPFKNNQIDYDSLEKILEAQVAAGVHGIVIGGSTGETAALDTDEYLSILKFSRKIVSKDTQLVAGVSSNINKLGIEIAQKAQSGGADALMCITPFYNKPPQRGIFTYFEDIHNNTSLPIMLYSVPGRTGVDLTDSTIIELSNLDRILGIKDAGPDLERPLRLLNKVKRSFSFLSGEDSSCIAYSSHGGSGCVSVISNLIPSTCKKLQDLMLEGNFSEALSINLDLYAIVKACFTDTNPIPIKYATSLVGLSTPEVRKPLSEIRDEGILAAIATEIKNLESKGLLK